MYIYYSNTALLVFRNFFSGPKLIFSVVKRGIKGVSAEIWSGMEDKEVDFPVGGGGGENSIMGRR
jgi:hypothetical protein